MKAGKDALPLDPAARAVASRGVAWGINVPQSIRQHRKRCSASVVARGRCLATLRTTGLRPRAALELLIVAVIVAGFGLAAPVLAAQPKASATSVVDASTEAPKPGSSRAEGERLGQLAASKRATGEYAACADAYLRAAETDATQPMHRYGEARCAQQEGERLRGSSVKHPEVRRWLERAQRAYDAFIAASGGDPELQTYREEASRHYGEVQALIEALPVRGTVEPDPVVVAAPQRQMQASHGTRRLGNWMLLGGGVAAVGGGVLGVVAKISYDDYAALGRTDASGATQAEAKSSAELQRNSAIALGAVGLVVAGLGAWFRWVAGEDGISSPAHALRLEGSTPTGFSPRVADRLAVEGR